MAGLASGSKVLRASKVFRRSRFSSRARAASLLRASSSRKARSSASRWALCCSFQRASLSARSRRSFFSFLSFFSFFSFFFLLFLLRWPGLSAPVFLLAPPVLFFRPAVQVAPLVSAVVLGRRAAFLFALFLLFFFPLRFFPLARGIRLASFLPQHWGLAGEASPVELAGDSPVRGVCLAVGAGLEGRTPDALALRTSGRGRLPSPPLLEVSCLRGLFGRLLPHRHSRRSSPSSGAAQLPFAGLPATLRCWAFLAPSVPMLTLHGSSRHPLWCWAVLAQSVPMLTLAGLPDTLFGAGVPWHQPCHSSSSPMLGNSSSSSAGKLPKERGAVRCKRRFRRLTRRMRSGGAARTPPELTRPQRMLCALGSHKARSCTAPLPIRQRAFH